MPFRTLFGQAKIFFGRNKDEHLELKNVTSITFRGADRHEVISALKRDNLAVIWGDREISLTIDLGFGFKGDANLFKNSKKLIRAIKERRPINFYFEFSEAADQIYRQRMMILEECHPTKLQFKKGATSLITVSIDFLISKFKIP